MGISDAQKTTWSAKIFHVKVCAMQEEPVRVEAFVTVFQVSEETFAMWLAAISVKNAHLQATAQAVYQALAFSAIDAAQ